jgi:hypothetical protein
MGAQIEGSDPARHYGRTVECCRINGRGLSGWTDLCDASSDDFRCGRS